MLNFVIKNQNDIEDFINEQRDIEEFIEVEYRTIGTQQLPSYFISTNGEKIRVKYGLTSPLREHENVVAMYKALDTFAYKGFLENAFLGNVVEKAVDALPPHELEIISANMVNWRSIPVDPLCIDPNLEGFTDELHKFVMALSNSTINKDTNILHLQANIIYATYQYALKCGQGLHIRKAIQAVALSKKDKDITDVNTALDLVNKDCNRYSMQTFTGHLNQTIYLVYDNVACEYLDNPFAKPYSQIFNELSND